MRHKSMDIHRKNDLFVRGCPQDRNKNKSLGGRSKSRDRSKSPRKYLRKYWKCGKVRNYKKYFISNKVDQSKGYDDSSSIEVKTFIEEGGDVYLESTSTHADCGVWLIDSGVSFHMTHHRDWIYKYEKYDSGDVFLGDDSTTKLMGHGRVKFLMKYGRIITLPGVLHIPNPTRILIFLSKLDDAGVDTLLGKGT
jgi:hypothetical protein